MDASTVQWWMKQSEEARKSLTKGHQVPIDEALKGLSFFIDDNEYQVWGNSARFDCGILVNAYEKLELGVPWKHFNERDVRTLVAFKPSVKKNMWFSGTPHYAPDDCKHQIKYCHETFKTLTSF